MNQSRQIRLALLASLLSVFLCAAILAGTAFAWFSDSVSNEGNTLQTGAVMATFAIGQQENDGNVTYSEIQGGQTQALKTTSWEPGKKETVAFRVTPQTGTLPYTYSIWLKSDAVNPELANYLELYQGQDSKTGTPLGTVAEKLNGPVVTGPGEENNTAEVSLTIRMKDDAPLSLVDQKMDLWFEVRADQPREDVTTAEDLQAQLNAGGLVKLGADIALDTTAQTDSPLLQVTQDTVLDLGDHTLSAALAEGQTLLEVKDGATLTLKGYTTETGSPADSEWGMDIGTNGICIKVDGGSKAYIRSGNYQGTENATIIQVENGYAEVDGGYFRAGSTPFKTGSDDGQCVFKHGTIAHTGSWSIGSTD